MFCLAALCAAALVTPALAHHSFAMFDRDRVVSVTGTVVRLDWSNPHAWLYLAVPDASGKVEEWGFEMPSPLQLTSKGWKTTTVKRGDRVILKMHPMKDGSHGGSYVSVTLPSGEVLGQHAAH